VEKRAERHKWNLKRLGTAKTECGMGKRLANLWGRSRVKQKAHAGRGQESKWEININSYGWD
jgi:hypothetical protein